MLGASDIGAIHAAPPLAAYADTAADDPAFLIYTSGTSRRPKGVLHAHRNVWGRRPTYAGWSGIGAADVMFHAGAFNWSYTLSAGLADPWANGATAVLYAGKGGADLRVYRVDIAQQRLLPLFDFLPLFGQFADECGGDVSYHHAHCPR